MFDERIMDANKPIHDNRLYYLSEHFDVKNHKFIILPNVLLFDYFFGLVSGRLRPDCIYTGAYDSLHMNSDTAFEVSDRLNEMRSTNGWWEDYIVVCGDMFCYTIEELDINAINVALFLSPKSYEITTMQWDVYYMLWIMQSSERRKLDFYNILTNQSDIRFIDRTQQENNLSQYTSGSMVELGISEEYAQNLTCLPKVMYKPNANPLAYCGRTYFEEVVE